jgi:hypothetical protein
MQVTMYCTVKQSQIHQDLTIHPVNQEHQHGVKLLWEVHKLDFLLIVVAQLKFGLLACQVPASTHLEFA